MAKSNEIKPVKASSVVAKSSDGTIQITFTIAFPDIQINREKALKELSESVEVPGFRKGKAPPDKVHGHITPNILLEKTLSYILPELLSSAVKEHDIRPIVYPKFELVSAKENEDWQIRAVTCEAPKITLGDYKNAVSGALKADSIWTPDKGDPDPKKEIKTRSHEDKEQLVLKALLDSCKVTIPSVLTDEEVNNRLSNLLLRIEKLGLSLDSYLASINKTAEDLRLDYKKQAEEGLALDFILNEIANQEKIAIDKSQVDLSIKAAASDPNLKENIDTPERRRFVEAILKRRKALDLLIS